MAPHEQLHERELALPLRVEDGQQLVPLAQLGLQRVAECLRHQPAAAAGRRLRLDVSVDLPEEPAELAQPADELTRRPRQPHARRRSEGVPGRVPPGYG